MYKVHIFNKVMFKQQKSIYIQIIIMSKVIASYENEYFATSVTPKNFNQVLHLHVGILSGTIQGI